MVVPLLLVLLRRESCSGRRQKDPAAGGADPHPLLSFNPKRCLNQAVLTFETYLPFCCLADRQTDRVPCPLSERQAGRGQPELTRAYEGENHTPTAEEAARPRADLLGVTATKNHPRSPESEQRKQAPTRPHPTPASTLELICLGPGSDELAIGRE